jgi:hypothetical protein
LVEEQKTRKVDLEKIFLHIFTFTPKFSLEFSLMDKVNYDNVGEKIHFKVVVKIIDKSSLRFVAKQKEFLVKEEYKKKHSGDVLIFK